MFVVRRFLFVCFLLVVLVSSLIGVVWLYKTPWLALDMVTFSDTQFISHDDLDEEGHQWLGRNTVLVRFFGGLSGELLSGFPQIDSLDLDILSRHHVHVSIEEKRPWVAFFVDGVVWYVSEDGSVLSKGGDMMLDTETPLVIVKGVSSDQFSDGRLSSVIRASVELVLKGLSTYLPGRSFQFEFKRVDLSELTPPFSQIVLYDDDTLPILVGDIRNLDDKLETLSALYQEKTLKKSNIRAIDLRVKGKAFIRYE